MILILFVCNFKTNIMFELIVKFILINNSENNKDCLILNIKSATNYIFN